MNIRIEKDSMGDVEVPESALYTAQTQRAVNNFPISSLQMPHRFIKSIGLVKAAAARANKELGLLPEEIADAIIKQASLVSSGKYYEHFPVDVFQTGSGTSSNMNANEVIATLAKKSGIEVHPNDHVNMSQSSNDVIPTTIGVSVSIATQEELLPALKHLKETIENKAKELSNTPKTGRTHLMDAMPITFAQELSAWSNQIDNCIKRLIFSLEETSALTMGGTAVGSGINAPDNFGEVFCKCLNAEGTVKFSSRKNKFEGLSSQDSIVQHSGSLKTLAVAIMKIANDLRLMNSGPLAGFGDISLPETQPGSSIMPGKVNPVIPESAAMVAAQVIGNDTCVTIAGQSGNFQLNVMLPVIAYNVLQSIEILTNTCRNIADKAIKGFVVNNENVASSLNKNPILVTALNRKIGYELGAKIAKTAYEQKLPIVEVAESMCDLGKDELESLLDPLQLTKGGIV